MEVSPMRRLSAVLLVAVAVAGCKKSEPPVVAPPAAPNAMEAQAAPPPAASIKGKVLERLDAPPYSYLRIQAGQQEQWAAVPKADVAKGTEVTVLNAMPMANFESKTLKRTFEVVFFGTLEGSAAAAPAPGMAPAGMEGSPAGMAQQHAKAAQGPSNVGDVKVPKASGADARTVAEVYAQKAALKEKSVTIRGKVVKFNPGIMGKNWVHLQDGSGKADKGDNDVTVTTQDMTAVGDTVLVKGTVRTDKDFGAGYAYPVIVEDAKLSK
jgi:hypothetical protein